MAKKGKNRKSLMRTGSKTMTSTSEMDNIGVSDFSVDINQVSRAVEAELRKEEKLRISEEVCATHGPLREALAEPA